jgi:hypothetical protein
VLKVDEIGRRLSPPFATTDTRLDTPKQHGPG